MIQPCVNLIPNKVEADDLKPLIDNRDLAGTDINLCLNDLLNNANWDDAEVRADFGKALVEEIIWNLTILKALEKADGTPKKFTPAIMSQVFYEHYAKGYHDADFELEYEE
jgi:hypothetical protein